ncbi:DUF1294 domain-containing protein [Marinomonas sp. 2405UD68-3]|uniref:DUF1294 domain-containing protein n=1 Tax=Marinomonas sp. 2405UD68-3 TaxID=3391835 RepID=UPI0039C956A8
MISSIITVIFVILLMILTVLDKLPLWLFIGYTVLSAIAFGMYALDKSAAKHNQWRTKESTLHLLGVLGGWPGALCAQHVFRHKTKKTSFRIVFWITVSINIATFYWFFSDTFQNMFYMLKV